MILVDFLTICPTVLGFVAEYLPRYDQITFRLCCKSLNVILSNYLEGWVKFGVSCIKVQGPLTIAPFRLKTMFQFPQSVSSFLGDLTKLVNSCHKRSFQLLHFEGIKQWGLASASVIPKGSKVLPYIGEYINTAECQHRNLTRPTGQVWYLAVLVTLNMMIESYFDTRQHIY